MVSDFFSLLFMEIFIWINLHGKQVQENYFTLFAEHWFNIQHTPYLEKWLFCIKQQNSAIYLWIVSTVKISHLQTCNIHLFKKSTKCKKYELASVSWFGPFHPATVSGFNFGCIAELPESRKIIHHWIEIYSKFGRYIMLAKDATYFNFLLPYALSEVIKGILKYSFSLSRCRSLFIACYYLLLL